MDGLLFSEGGGVYLKMVIFIVQDIGSCYVVSKLV